MERIRPGRYGGQMAWVMMRLAVPPGTRGKDQGRMSEPSSREEEGRAQLFDATPIKICGALLQTTEDDGNVA